MTQFQEVTLVANGQSRSGEENARLFASGACPSYFSNLNRQPVLAEVLKKRKVSAEAVCACIAGKFESDKKLVAALNVDESQLKKLYESKRFESYLLTRLMHSGLVCLAPELEAALVADAP